MSAPKLIESIPTVTAPVKVEMPKLSRRAYVTWLVVGAAFIATDLALIAWGVAVTW